MGNTLHHNSSLTENNSWALVLLECRVQPHRDPPQNRRSRCQTCCHRHWGYLIKQVNLKNLNKKTPFNPGGFTQPSPTYRCSPHLLCCGGHPIRSVTVRQIQQRGCNRACNHGTPQHAPNLLRSQPQERTFTSRTCSSKLTEERSRFVTTGPPTPKTMFTNCAQGAPGTGFFLAPCGC